LQLLELLLTSFTLGSGDFPFHLLDLKVCVIKKLLLALLLNLEFGDVGLQVSACGQSARYVTNQISLISSQLEKLL
jgi:hypothetical protein